MEKKEKKEKKSYICPFCEKEQNTAIHWQKVLTAFEFNLENGESKEADKGLAEHVGWACPECGKELPPEICRRIEEILGW